MSGEHAVDDGRRRAVTCWCGGLAGTEDVNLRAALALLGSVLPVDWGADSTAGEEKRSEEEEHFVNRLEWKRMCFRISLVNERVDWEEEKTGRRECVLKDIFIFLKSSLPLKLLQSAPEAKMWGSMASAQ